MARKNGFTLIELLVVLAIVALLLTLALPRYMGSTEIAKERVLVENLRTTRDAIDKHFADRGRYPESLEVLVERRYLRDLPYDPVRESNSAWNIVSPPGGRDGGIYDLHSSASGATHDGRAFSEL